MTTGLCVLWIPVLGFVLHSCIKMATPSTVKPQPPIITPSGVDPAAVSPDKPVSVTTPLLPTCYGAGPARLPGVHIN